MSKIWLVTEREYITRVKNKTFILTTLLTPIGILLFSIAVAFVMSQGSDKTKTIHVVDTAGLVDQDIEGRKNLDFVFNNLSLDENKKLYKEGKCIGIIEILPMQDSLSDKYAFKYHSDDQLALDETSSIESAIAKKIRNYKLKKMSISEETLSKIDTDVTMIPETILDDKKISSLTTVISSMLGIFVGFAMFFIILIYGSQVMRSVMEEKINRIIEVLISSVKPFDLMMGKVLGVGLVGLTQVAIWLLLIPIMFMISTHILGIDTSTVNALPDTNIPEGQMLNAKAKMTQIVVELQSMNWLKILPITFFYFLAGYFAYSALFAAVGSAVGEDINEAQSLTMPVMMPLIFAFYIGVSAVNAPDSTLAVWASMIPLLSSVVMPVRLPFDPPMWQILVSMVSLLIFTIFLVWLAARIYRVGILMYGKKASFKELAKWMMYKE
jgi:ABC-2 type transport system permease protein